MYLGIILEPVKPLHSGFNFRVVQGKDIVDSQILLDLQNTI